MSIMKSKLSDVQIKISKNPSDVSSNSLTTGHILDNNLNTEFELVWCMKIYL